MSDPSPKLDDFADLLERRRVNLPANEEARFMLQTLENCFRHSSWKSLERAARVLTELSQMWGRHHGPGWVLTPKAEQALAAHVQAAADDDPTIQAWQRADDPTPLSDAGEGC